jgi:hypothetical protein
MGRRNTRSKSTGRSFKTERMWTLQMSTLGSVYDELSGSGKTFRVAELLGRDAFSREVKSAKAFRKHLGGEHDAASAT